MQIRLAGSECLAVYPVGYYGVREAAVPDEILMGCALAEIAELCVCGHASWLVAAFGSLSARSRLDPSVAARLNGCAGAQYSYELQASGFRRRNWRTTFAFARRAPMRSPNAAPATVQAAPTCTTLRMSLTLKNQRCDDGLGITAFKLYG